MDPFESTAAGPGWSRRRNRGWVYADVVDAAADGWKAVEFYARRHPHSSPAEWRRRLEEGRVRGPRGPVAAGEGLRAGQRLEYHRPPWTEPPAPRRFSVIGDDGDLVAVAKPRGLQVLPGAEFLENTLLHVVRERLDGSPAPAHRLGRGTSGIVLFARSAAARRGLAAAFENRRVHKLYRALAQGLDMDDRFTVEAAIGPVPHPHPERVFAARADGRPARSRVRVLERRPSEGAALVEVEIPTGRPHQIRIHLAAAGFPLVGEPLYEAGGSPRPPAAGQESPRPGETGYLLHAVQLSCGHPTAHARVSFYCRPPAELLHAGERSGPQSPGARTRSPE